MIPLLRSFTVFNAAQIDGLPDKLRPAPVDEVVAEGVALPDWTGCETAERILTDSKANIRHGGGRAYYVPALDVIQLPERSAFASAADYYRVALH